MHYYSNKILLPSFGALGLINIDGTSISSILHAAYVANVVTPIATAKTIIAKGICTT